MRICLIIPPSSFLLDERVFPSLGVLRDGIEYAVRAKLGIPYPVSRPALRYEHSMGQGLPGFLLQQG